MVNRRAVLLGIGATVAAGAFAKVLTPPKPDKTQLSYDSIERSAKALDAFLTREKPDYLILGDTNHSLEHVKNRIMNHPDMIDVFVKHGFLDLAMEVRHEQQPVVDQLVKHEITIDGFKEQISRQWVEQGKVSPREIYSASQQEAFEDRGRMLVNMHKAGMTAHMVEGQYENLAEHDRVADNMKIVSKQIGNDRLLQQGMGGFLRSVARTVLFNTGVMTKDVGVRLETQDGIDAEKNASRKTPSQSIHAAITAERIEGDRDLAARILARTEGRKTLIEYGAAHVTYDKRNTLDDVLRETGKKVSTVSLLLSPGYLPVIHQNDVNQGDAPDAYLDPYLGKVTESKDLAGVALCIKKDGAAILPPRCP